MVGLVGGGGYDDGGGGGGAGLDKGVTDSKFVNCPVVRKIEFAESSFEWKMPQHIKKNNGKK